MSFIIKNLDSSRPNLQIGDVLESMLQAEISSWYDYYRNTIIPTFGNVQGSEMSIMRSGLGIYRCSIWYWTAEMINSQYTGDKTKLIQKADATSQIYHFIRNLANQLFMPNMANKFPEMLFSEDNQSFECGISMITAYSSFAGAYQTKFSGNGATGNNALTIPSLIGGIATYNKAEFLAGQGQFSIGFKYFSDAEKSLESARLGGYVVLEVVPFMYTIRGERKYVGHRLTINFPEYNVESPNTKLLFNNASLVLENVKHMNDLPDDQNTYPGGGDDKNHYPEDDEDEGLNSSGKGTFDNTNNPVDFPGMPLWDATSTGFISMWNPTVTELIDLYGFLWDSEISTTLKKLFLEPMDAIISLALFPVDPINFEGKRAVSIGHVDTGITMNAVQKQFVDFDFGTLKLDEYYGAAWDYSPYTKVSIYLPYIGSQELDVDDVMNATLHLKYRIDLLSGMCVAMLKAGRERDGLDAVIYTWQGNCAMQVPITAGSARDFLNSIIQLGAMTGLALTQPAAGAISSAMHAKDEDHENTSMGNNWVNPTMATYNALNVLGQKVHVQRGGRVDANAGVMSPQSAYIIVNRPISAIPRGWNEYAGYPSLKVKNLSTQKGYTQVAYIKLNGLEATAREISELDGILKGGVIL